MNDQNTTCLGSWRENNNPHNSRYHNPHNLQIYNNKHKFNIQSKQYTQICMHACMQYDILFMHHTQNGSVIFSDVTKLIQLILNQLSNNSTQEFSITIS